MLTIISWNIARRREAWLALHESHADVALLQEACEPPADCASIVESEAGDWQTGSPTSARRWRTSVVCLKPAVELRRHAAGAVGVELDGVLAVSCPGTMAAADVTDPGTGETFTVVSMYAPWERPHAITSSEWIYADASAHRVVSDLSAFIGQQNRHRIIAAGDLNILHGHGEHGSAYWARRYQTVFDRLSALGLTFVGPQWPNGRRAEPWPDELPTTSLNVPTYHTNWQTPATATRQLDFVFASDAMAHRVRVVAQNNPDDWGPSDHCRVRIEVGA